MWVYLMVQALIWFLYDRKQVETGDHFGEEETSWEKGEGVGVLRGKR